ncbi:beta-glucosidase BglX [Lutibacter citreus]|uniref:beta-glucosidase BglX n=1 Tax=Lutibacter citreus TaxID=2138210 RepID=UPI000DBE82EC|nr:beta-glucosidase BglX [Lutibacter citreus]
MRNAILLLTFFIVSIANAQIKGIEQRIDSVMSLMTLEEKVGQMIQVNGKFVITGPQMYDVDYEEQIKSGMVGSFLNAVGVDYTRDLQRIAVEETRLGIPLLFGFDVIHGWRTTSPVPIAESASWDMEVVENGARVAATEAAAAGQHWTFAPMVDIARDPRWGRIVEGAGEDPYLGSKIAAARVHGFQGDDLSATNTIAACAKHFAGYGAAEGGRDYNTADMSERTLRDIYLPPFKAAVDAGVQTFMTSLHELSGVPTAGNKFLLDQVLRKEWGFDGFVVSDHSALNEMINHGIVENQYDASVLSATAGCDMDMQSQAYFTHLKDAVQAGDVPIAKVNTSVRRILRIKFRMGLMDDPYLYCNKEREKNSMLTKEHLAIVRAAASKSCVLLKNENNILPISKKTKIIAVIGPLANAARDMNGSWRGQANNNDVVSLLAGIKNAVSSKTEILYHTGCGKKSDDKTVFQEALEMAKKADVVILAIGENGDQTGENRSKSNIGIPEIQIELAKEILKVNKNVATILFNGRPITMKWLADNMPSILEAWYPGTQGGNGVADVIFGDYNPSGKLPASFPIVVGQCPIYYNYKNTGRPIREGFKWQTKYLDVPNKPLYPFGYGLSYTSFEYSNLLVNKKEVHFKEELEVSVTLKNTGKYDGAEIVQLYVRDLFGSVTRPVKELKGFEKVMLKAGEEKVVTFKLTSDDLRFHNIDMDYVAEKGDFKVFVGGNSNDVIESEFKLIK